MKKELALFLAAVLTALALTACGGGGYSSGGDSGSSASPASVESLPADYQVSEAPSGSGWAGEPAAEEDRAETEGDDRLASAKMIYTANIEAETMDFDACAAGLETLVDQTGGYMEYASAASYGDGYRVGSYTVRIPAARFEGFLKSVGDIGHVVSQDRSAENISELYYDTESRLITQKTKLERLQTLLAKAESMEDIITLESAIAETELQIEQLTGSLRHYDALVDYATVEIRLREVVRLSTVEETPPTFSSQLGNAFVDGLHGFGDFLQGLAIFLAYNWTWMLLLAVIAVSVVTGSRRRRARRGESFSQPAAPKRDFFKRDRKDESKNPDDKQGKD